MIEKEAAAPGVRELSWHPGLHLGLISTSAGAGGPGVQPRAGYTEMHQGAQLLKEIAAGQPSMTAQSTSLPGSRGCRDSSPSGLGAAIQEGAQVQTPYPGLTSMSLLPLWGRSWGRNSLPLLKKLGKMLTAHLQNSIKALSSAR